MNPTASEVKKSEQLYKNLFAFISYYASTQNNLPDTFNKFC